MSEAGDVDPPEPKGSQVDVLEADRECISVDAGAGSGKTTTMRWRIERMLNAADAPLSSRVLVLTFANEAAAAIQKSITEADDLTIEQAYNVDVYTYHSFCSQLVSEYAYMAGLDPDFDVITEEQRQRMIQGLIEDNDYQYVTRRRGEVEGVVGEAVKYIREMRQEAVTPEAVDALLPPRSAVGELKRLVIDLEREATELFDPDANEFIADDFTNNAGNIAPNLDAYRDALDRWRLVASHRSDDIWDRVDAYIDFLESWVDIVEKFIDMDSEAALGFLPQALFGDDIHGGFWTDLEQTPFDHLKSYVEALEAIHGLQEIYREYVDALDERGALDFDELINRAHELIYDSPVREEIKGRWDYVFCDEFQDTDDVQLDVVKGLCQDGGAQLLAIGDVDQAIYGWRGANPEGLTELGDAFDEHEKIRITRNFRSEQEILELVNQCTAYESKPLVSDACESVTADGEPMVTRSEGDEARLGIVNGDWTGLTTAEEVATTISQLLEGGFSDITERTLEDLAVIVRTNRQAREVAAQLRNRQIPYRIDGTRESDLQPGVQTVLSYFQTLADPTADVHLRRVLMLVYRVPAADLQALERADTDSLDEAVMNFEDIGSVSLDEPERLAAARQDITDLRAAKDRHSLPYFYRLFLETSRVEWYLQEDDRAQLDRIKKFIQGYKSDSVLRQFSEEFVDNLARSLQGWDGDVGVGIGSYAEDKVNILTVHKAKGLQFDTVLFPYLEDEEWVSMNCPGWVETSCATWKAHRYKSIIRSLKNEEFTHALADSTFLEQEQEDWRTFHVGVTRAESLLVVFSQSPEDTDHWQSDVAYLRELFDRSSLEAGEPEDLIRESFPDVGTPWAPEHPRMGLWPHLREAFVKVRDRYPETVVDLSDDVDHAASQTLGTITYWAQRDRELDLEEAIVDIHAMGERMLDGDLSGGDPTTYGVHSVPLGFDDATKLPVTHSHTSLETFSDCSLRHLLDHVLYGFDDPIPAEAEIGRSDTPSWRKVGNVFHAVAEEAFYRSNSEEAEWLDICDRVIRARDVESVRDAVEECIHRFFRTDVPEWEAVAAELPFELTGVPDVQGPIVGFMDSVRRVPGQGLTVLDYKTTFEKRDIESSSQLLLYLRACEELFDEPVEWAGYVYVGVAGADDGAVEMIHRDHLEGEWDGVVKLLQAADTPSWNPEPGDHCEFCPHRSLGCAPEEYAYHNEYVVDMSGYT